MFKAYDRIIAVNPASGAMIAGISLASSNGIAGGVYDAATGHVFIAENNGPGNRIIELSAATGEQLAVISAPFNMWTWAGLAIDPVSGHLWLGSANGGPQLVEYRIDGLGAFVELRRIDTRAQRLDGNEITGLSFSPDGTLYISSTLGEIYRLAVT